MDADKPVLERVKAITPAYFFDRAKGLAFASQLSNGTGQLKTFHDVMPGSKLRSVAKAGHYPWLEQPDAFREIIREFLKDWAPDKSK
jgi:pimeloyl-ACP methyl ester carboxylesterase